MIILMGVSGAGKGTQSEKLVAKSGYSYLSTGEILRRFATEEQRKRMLAGKWLEDSEIIGMVDDALRSMPDPNKSVLDGFPRTLVQARWLLGQSSRPDGLKIEAVFNLIVPAQVVHDRLLSRGRQDDTEEAIAERVREHDQFTRPVIDMFRSNGLQVFDIDGTQVPEEVHNAILGHLNNLHIMSKL